ncbi:hypothetical protein EU527_18410, partial [Candidatus Thorarchaeota archaeon]
EMESIKAKVLQMFGEVEVDPSWSFADISRTETAKWTHGYHRYPAKFIPQLVERLFDEYVTSSHAHVNDPFFGSGTTIVTAISRGYIASGTDINGIALLMTQAKSVPIDPSYLDLKIKRFLAGIRPTSTNHSLGGDSSLIKLPEKNIERIEYWFPEKNKMEIGRILKIILNESDLLVRRFLLVAFSHILKNCSIWLQRSTKPTRDHTKSPKDPYLSIRSHLKKMVHGNRAFYEKVPEHVRSNIHDYLKISQNDARSQPLVDSCVDLIVSSSPYVTSYEYADLHQLSTLWLELADDYNTHRKEFIGTGFCSASKRNPRSEIAQEIITQINPHKKTAQEIREYFCDMEEVFRESYRILKDGGRCCYVIGNTALKGVDILNAQVFAESLVHCGFQIEKIVKREIPSKILPQTRDKGTGRFSSSRDATSEAYPTEYIVIGIKP